MTVSHEAIRISILWSTIFCAMFGLVMALFPTSDYVPVYKRGPDFIQGWPEGPCGQMAFPSFFRLLYCILLPFLALGKAKGRLCPRRMPAGNLLCSHHPSPASSLGINGILYAQPIADVISAIITVFIAVHLHRELLIMGKGYEFLKNVLLMIADRIINDFYF